MSSEKDGLDVNVMGVSDDDVAVVSDAAAAAAAGRNEEYGLDCICCCDMEDLRDDDVGGESSIGMTFELLCIGGGGGGGGGCGCGCCCLLGCC